VSRRTCRGSASCTSATRLTGGKRAGRLAVGRGEDERRAGALPGRDDQRRCFLVTRSTSGTTLCEASRTTRMIQLRMCMGGLCNEAAAGPVLSSRVSTRAEAVQPYGKTQTHVLEAQRHAREDLAPGTSTASPAPVRRGVADETSTVLLLAQGATARPRPPTTCPRTGNDQDYSEHTSCSSGGDWRWRAGTCGRWG